MKEEVVLYVGGFELPDKNAAAHRVLSVGKILRENGKKVVFVGVDKSIEWNKNVLDTYADVQGFDTYSVPYPDGKKKWIRYLTEIDRYLTICNVLGNVSMIIMYNFQAVAAQKLYSFCKKNGIKCCADITEWRLTKGENIVYGILKNTDTWYRMKVLNKKLDGLIVISRYLENYYKNCKNVVYLPPLIDYAEDKWKEKYAKSTDVLKIVYAGSPGRKDRLDIMIEALDGLKRSYVLDVIGITAEQYLEYYPKHVEVLKRHSDIVFHGRMSHLDTLKYVKKANYSCFLRLNDRVSKAGFPTKFVEAITCGTPVLTNESSNIMDYVIENNNGFIIKSLCVDEIRSCVERVPFIVETNRKLFDYSKYKQQMQLFVGN